MTETQLLAASLTKQQQLLTLILSALDKPQLGFHSDAVVEIAEAKKIIVEAMSGGVGVAPPYYKPNSKEKNPERQAWSDWIKSLNQ